MVFSSSSVPDATIETLARSFYKQALKYGFRREDYLRFVNVLLEYAMHSSKEDKIALASRREAKQKIRDYFDNTESVALPISGEKVCIRDFDPENDHLLLQRWMNDDFGRFFLLSRTTERAITLDQLLKNERTILGMITLPESKPIGAVAFLHYDSDHPKAELRKVIGEPDMRGKGYGKEATRLWIQYGISGLGLKKIYLHTLNTNIRNIKLNEEMGFQVEGILRNEALIDGEYHDVLRMGLWQE